MRTLRLDVTTLHVESFDVDSLPQACLQFALPTLVSRMAACCAPTMMAAQEGQ